MFLLGAAGEYFLKTIESRELACEDSDVDLLNHGQDQEQNFTKFLTNRRQPLLKCMKKME